MSKKKKQKPCVVLFKISFLVSYFTPTPHPLYRLIDSNIWVLITTLYKYTLYNVCSIYGLYENPTNKKKKSAIEKKLYMKK